jgi:hypothetical protein
MTEPFSFRLTGTDGMARRYRSRKGGFGRQ